jgi:hypothetical protein
MIVRRYDERTKIRRLSTVPLMFMLLPTPAQAVVDSTVPRATLANGLSVVIVKNTLTLVDVVDFLHILQILSGDYAVSHQILMLTNRSHIHTKSIHC